MTTATDKERAHWAAIRKCKGQRVRLKEGARLTPRRGEPSYRSPGGVLECVKYLTGAGHFCGVRFDSGDYRLVRTELLEPEPINSVGN